MLETPHRAPLAARWLAEIWRAEVHARAPRGLSARRSMSGGLGLLEQLRGQWRGRERLQKLDQLSAMRGAERDLFE